MFLSDKAYNRLMRTPVDDIFARLSTLVRYGVERMFVRLNLFLALLLATYALNMFYQFHPYDIASGTRTCHVW